MRLGTSWEKKDKQVDPHDPADEQSGSQWDHVAFDAPSKLAVSLVVGTRSAENTRALLDDFAARTDSVLPGLFTSDEYPVYAQALLTVYGEWVVPARTGKPGRKRQPYQMPPEGLVYATVKKTRRRGRVVSITLGIVYSPAAQVAAALAYSPVSRQVNTTFVERYHGTTRQHNSRKQRKVYTFSKELADHQAMSWYALSYYNFCRPRGSLRMAAEDGRYRPRTPAMAANLTDHVWSLREFMSYPLPHRVGEVGH